MKTNAPTINNCASIFRFNNAKTFQKINEKFFCVSEGQFFYEDASNKNKMGCGASKTEKNPSPPKPSNSQDRLASGNEPSQSNLSGSLGQLPVKTDDDNDIKGIAVVDTSKSNHFEKEKKKNHIRNVFFVFLIFFFLLFKSFQQKFDFQSV